MKPTEGFAAGFQTFGMRGVGAKVAVAVSAQGFGDSRKPDTGKSTGNHPEPYLYCTLQKAMLMSCKLSCDLVL